MSARLSKPYNEWNTILSKDAYSECSLAATLDWEDKEQTKSLTIGRDGSIKEPIYMKNTIHTKSDRFYQDLLIKKNPSSSIQKSKEEDNSVFQHEFVYKKSKDLVNKKKMPSIPRAE